MNFQIGVLLCVAACAFALPLPDEEVSTLLKTPEVVAPLPTATPVEGLKTEQPSSVKSPVAGNVQTENAPKTEAEPELGTPTESLVDGTSVSHEEIREVPKSLPVTARGGTEAVVPPFAGVRVEPKEGVEVGESKSTASSPSTEETENKSESKPVGEEQPSTEGNASASVEKKDQAPSAEEKPKVEEASSSTPVQPVVAGETKPEESAPTTAEPTEANKTNLKLTDSKDKHDHSSESNKTVESAESSEESDEKSK